MTTTKTEDASTKWTTTETVTTVTRSINTVENGNLPNYGLISVVPYTPGKIHLVVGADFENKCASRFDKKSLKQLIDILTEIHDAMEYTDD